MKKAEKLEMKGQFDRAMKVSKSSVFEKCDFAYNPSGYWGSNADP